EGGNAEPEGKQQQNRAEEREHHRQHELPHLALEVDPDQAQHGAEHYRRPLISPMTSPTQRAPVTTASGFRRATRSNSATMEPAWSFAVEAISDPRSVAASPICEPTNFAMLATVSLSLDTSSLS